MRSDESSKLRRTGFFCFYWNTADLQCYVSFRCTMQWFTCIHCEMITMISISLSPYKVIKILLMISLFYIVHLWLVYSVQFSRSVVSDSLWSHLLRHARPPCPSPTPGAYSISCPSSRWCHPTVSSSVIHFSSHHQSFPASGSFPMSSSHQVVTVLEFQLQHQSFQWIFTTDFL